MSFVIVRRRSENPSYHKRVERFFLLPLLFSPDVLHSKAFIIGVAAHVFLLWVLISTTHTHPPSHPHTHTHTHTHTHIYIYLTKCKNIKKVKNDARAC